MFPVCFVKSLLYQDAFVVGAALSKWQMERFQQQSPCHVFNTLRKSRLCHPLFFPFPFLYFPRILWTICSCPHNLKETFAVGMNNWGTKRQTASHCSAQLAALSVIRHSRHIFGKQEDLSFKWEMIEGYTLQNMKISHQITFLGYNQVIYVNIIVLFASVATCCSLFMDSANVKRQIYTQLILVLYTKAQNIWSQLRPGMVADTVPQTRNVWD